MESELVFSCCWASAAAPLTSQPCDPERPGVIHLGKGTSHGSQKRNGKELFSVARVNGELAVAFGEQGREVNYSLADRFTKMNKWQRPKAKSATVVRDN